MEKIKKKRSFESLNAVASDVLSKLRRIPDYKNAKIVIVGGLAVQRYLPATSTKDVDFLIQIEGGSQAVKSKLMALDSPALTLESQALCYSERDVCDAQIDLIPTLFCPFIPAEAVEVQDTQDEDLPYISMVDLIVFKVWTCGLRPTLAKRQRDKLHAKGLLKHLKQRNRPLSLSFVQRAAVEEGLDGLLRVKEHVDGVGNEDPMWWKESLGLCDETE